MILSDRTAVHNIFYNNTLVNLDVGCTIEYNMNSIIPGVKATYASSLEPAYQLDETGRINIFKKLFPIDTIIKPNRPESGGIKYYIVSSIDTPSNSFSPYRTLQYPAGQPRIYYPGVSTYYKYWITPKNSNIDVTVTYKQAENPEDGNKHAMCNKIIVKFEKNHTLPTAYTLYITKSDNTIISSTFTTVPSSGIINHYYNGSNFNSISEPTNLSSPILIKSIRLTAVNPGGGKYLGLIELSARWIQDISSDIVSLNVNKESSNDSESAIPVGFVTSNSIEISLTNYNQSELKYVYYLNTSSTDFNANKIYIVKNAELKPYFKIKHSAATDVVGQYDIARQGVYYIDTFEKSQYGEVQISALDGAKYLMETIIPEMLCEDYPVTAIIRRMLDTVGFTSYNFNLKSEDDSIPLVAYWWADGTKTVWQCIQELCRDIQMNAVFDSNGVLQFYSRRYIYDVDSRTIDWELYHTQNGSKLPNIISLSDRGIVGANEVKILWQAPVASDLLGNSDFLWESGPTFLTAGALMADIGPNATPSVLNNTSNDQIFKGFVISSENPSSLNQTQSSFNFSGYFLVNSEIFEYDAIQYQYVPKESLTNTPIKIWVTSASDLSKYKYLAKSGFENQNDPSTAFFRPTGRYRIKSRAALGTKAQTHRKTGSIVTSIWKGRRIKIS